MLAALLFSAGLRLAASPTGRARLQPLHDVNEQKSKSFDLLQVGLVGLEPITSTMSSELETLEITAFASLFCVSIPPLAERYFRSFFVYHKPLQLSDFPLQLSDFHLQDSGFLVQLPMIEL